MLSCPQGCGVGRCGRQQQQQRPGMPAFSSGSLLPFPRPRHAAWRVAAVRRQSSSSSSSGSGGGGGGDASGAAAQEAAMMQRVLQALRSDPEYRAGSVYRCRNGHLYVVGGCTNPAEVARCPACGAVIGTGSGDSRVAGL